MAENCECLGRSVQQRKARRQEQRQRRQNERALNPPKVRLRAIYLSPHERRQVDAALTAPAYELAYDPSGVCIGIVVHGRSLPNRPRFASKRGPSGRVDRQFLAQADELTTALDEQDRDAIQTTACRAGALMRLARWADEAKAEAA